MIRTLVGSRIFLLPSLQELEELLGPPLLEQAHEGAANSFHLVTRHLRDLSFAVDKAARNLLELQVASDIGVDKNLGELAGRDDELRDEIDSVVAVTAKFSRRSLIRPELAVQLLQQAYSEISVRSRP